MKNYLIITGLALSLAGCAGTTAIKTVGSTCATAGAAYSAIAIRGTPQQAQIALNDASVLTPICNSSTPSTALSTGAVSAFANLMSMAKPLMITSPTGSTKS